jgi:hypothetical protein
VHKLKPTCSWALQYSYICKWKQTQCSCDNRLHLWSFNCMGNKFFLAILLLLNVIQTVFTSAYFSTHLQPIKKQERYELHGRPRRGPRKNAVMTTEPLSPNLQHLVGPDSFRSSSTVIRRRSFERRQQPRVVLAGLHLSLSVNKCHTMHSFRHQDFTCNFHFRYST